MQAMQAALLDSALYVRFLRAKLLELQLSEHRTGSQGALRPYRVSICIWLDSTFARTVTKSGSCRQQSVCALAVSCR